jgi:hypothetical protein
MARIQDPISEKEAGSFPLLLDRSKGLWRDTIPKGPTGFIQYLSILL